MTLPSAKEIRETAVRQAINDLLPSLSEKQASLLHRIHASAPWKNLENCPENQLDITYELIRRTLDRKPE